MWGSEVANYETEIHIAKYNKRGDAVSCNVTTIEHEGEKCESSVFTWLHLSIDMILPRQCGALRLLITREIHIAKYDKRGDAVMQ